MPRARPPSVGEEPAPEVSRALARALDPLLFGAAGLLGDGPGPGARRSWRRLAGGPAARSFLWRVRDGAWSCVVKVYRSALRDAPREVWADRWGPPGLAPRVLGAVVSGARTRVDAAVRSALAPHAYGAVVVMSDVGGRPCPSSPARWGVEALARCAAALHEARPRRGPAALLPSSPDALGALASSWLEQLDRRGRSPRAELRRAGGVLAAARRRAEGDRLFARPVRRLIHGDLRFSNLHLVGREGRLVDLEHAGLADPALDLALLTWRAPLSPDQERTFFDTYLATSRDRTVGARYALLFPLVALAVELGVALDRADELDRGALARPSLSHRTPVASPLAQALDRLATRA